jgi:hypothetical protein
MSREPAGSEPIRASAAHSISTWCGRPRRHRAVGQRDRDAGHRQPAERDLAGSPEIVSDSEIVARRPARHGPAFRRAAPATAKMRESVPKRVRRSGAWFDPRLAPDPKIVRIATAGPPAPTGQVMEANRDHELPVPFEVVGPAAANSADLRRWSGDRRRARRLVNAAVGWLPATCARPPPRRAAPNT